MAVSNTPAMNSFFICTFLWFAGMTWAIHKPFNQKVLKFLVWRMHRNPKAKSAKNFNLGQKHG
jgi:hypothetical protein